jgi:hypothetical protein
MSGIRLAGLFVLLTAVGCTSIPWKFGNREEEPPVFLAEEEEMEFEPLAEFSALPIVEPSGEAVSALGVAPFRRFKDMPLPVGAREDIERTYVYESPKLQIGRMVYSVKGTLNELTRFFQLEYKAEGWMLKSVLRTEGADLQFEKKDKRLRVTVGAGGRTTRTRLVTLNLVPAESSLN